MPNPTAPTRTAAAVSLRSILLDRKAELLLALDLNAGRRAGVSDQALGGVPSPLASGNERVARVLAAKLNRVSEALNRIDSGTFGDCMLCGESIPHDRLQILPWERHCESCREKRSAAGNINSAPSTPSRMVLHPMPKLA